MTDTLGTALGTGVSGAIIAAGIRASGQPVPGLAIAFGVAIAVGSCGSRPDGPAAPSPERGSGRVRHPASRQLAVPATTAEPRPVATPAVDFGAPTPPLNRRRAADDGGPAIVSAEELRAKIREVPDFPKPGILFYDITTLLKDARRTRKRST